jgi:hypothetical protein
MDKNGVDLWMVGTDTAKSALFARLDGDLMYTPGWSEMRRQRDLDIAEYKGGLRLGQDVRALPVNVRMVRRVDANMQTPNGTNLLRAKNQGYRPITKADIGQEWFTELPPGAREMPDGTIVNVAGDLQYVVAEAASAARNMKRKQQAAVSQAEASAARQDGLLRTASQFRGAEPTAGIEDA